MHPLRNSPVDGVEDFLYHFPYSRSAVELLPDTAGTFGVRLSWHRGKAIFPIFETSPLRPIAEVWLRGQTFPVFLNQHSRKRRDRIVLGGRRKTSRSARCALRFLAFVEGREDRLLWNWRIGATAGALEVPIDTRSTEPSQLLADLSKENGHPQSVREPTPDSVCLHLPFGPGRSRIFQLPGIEHALAAWVNDVAVTIVAPPPQGSGTQRLVLAERGIDLRLENADLSGHGVSLIWETWLSPARTEADVCAALLKHLADHADRSQKPTMHTAPFLRELHQTSTHALMQDRRVEKRGADRLAFRVGDANQKRVGVGEGTDATLTAAALVGSYLLTRDDAIRRHARLLSKGACDFQISTEDSPHWGGVWDTLREKRHFEDCDGGSTIGTVATARFVRGLHRLHAHFGTDMLARTAHNGAQWLLLKSDRDNFPVAERFESVGPPLYGGSPWAVGETVIALVETFRATGNETFLRAALRGVHALRERLENNELSPAAATTSQISAAIEGALLVSREYESETLLALARQLGMALRARRRQDGSLSDPLGRESVQAATLAGVRAALALTRVESDPIWITLALRALRSHNWDNASIAELGQCCSLSMGVLLAVGAQAKNCVADRDTMSITRGWQTFAPDPSSEEYIQVRAVDGSFVDYLTLVCPFSLQVFIAVVAPPQIDAVTIVKNQKTPFLRHLLTGDYDCTTPLIPLGDGAEANMGVFLADT